MIPNLSNPKITYKLSLFCMNNSLDLVSLNISCNGMTKDYFFLKKKRKSKPKYFHQLKITNSNNFFIVLIELLICLCKSFLLFTIF